MKSIIREDLRNNFSFSTDDGIQVDNDTVYKSRYTDENTFQIFINGEWRTIEGIDFDVVKEDEYKKIMIEKLVSKQKESIAKFMGARYYGASKEYELYGVIECIEDGEDEQHFFTGNQMKFDTSWDWLKPVIDECIRKIGVVTIDECSNEQWCIYTNICQMYIGVDIKIAYNYVIEFINFYNSFAH